MSIHKNVAEILENHINLAVECIDRMYLNVYVPQLQRPEGGAAFFKDHRQETFASSALMAPMTHQFVKSIKQFVEEHGIELVKFEKKVRKDDLMLKRLAKFEEDEGIVFVGQAQEKAIGRPYRKTSQ